VQVSWAGICREFIETDEGLDVLGLGVDGYDVFEDFPVKLPLNVVYEVTAEAGAAGEPQTLVASVFGPDRQLLDRAAFPAPVPVAAPVGPSARQVRRLDRMFLPLVAVGEGDYRIEIQLDGQPPAACLALRIRRASGC
jgi:hypothetical protein